jgi:UDP-N-acetylmuramoylalanine--D-glutamate ligase
MDRAKAYFKGKKVTVLGLGLLGKGLGDTAFLARCGAQVTVTDLKDAKALASSVAQLKKYKNVRFVLGRHEMSDFQNCDMVLKAQGVPLDSIYINEARNNHIPIRMDDELLVSLLPKNVKVIGITGTRGKTTVTSLIYHILKKAGKRVHLGGNIRGVATLSLLPKIKSGDYVVLELSSWQLQGFGEQKISPNISVFTNFMPDHMNYYKNNLKDYFSDKAFIFKYQKEGDILVAGESVVKKIPKSYKGNLVVGGDVPKNWKLPLPGEHNKENITLAVSAARALRIPLAKIKLGVESFKAVEGRLQVVKTVRGVQIYNDNNSTTPEATIAGLKSFPKKQTVLIMGGADKNLDTIELLKTAEAYAHTVILLPGTGTDKIENPDFYRAESLKDAVETAVASASKGDVILFSPAFASFGLFVNEYDRNDQFMNLVKKLK